jgi:hypothetical protein
MQKRLGLLILAVLLVSFFTAFGNNTAQAATQTFPQTGYTVSDEHGFLAYWNKSGGLAIFGYPISPERQEVNPADGKTYWVQWFERNRFEWHPENRGTKYEIQLGLLGKQLTKGRENETPFKAVPAVPTTANLTYFAATGHTLRGNFKATWEKYGGLEQFGYPLTEDFAERNPEDNKVYSVQWFERARFEYHPENIAPNDVLLGLLGKQALNPPTTQPTSTPSTSPSPSPNPSASPNPSPSPSPNPSPSPSPSPSPNPGATVIPTVDLPLPTDAKPIPLTQAEFDNLKKDLSVLRWDDLKFGYFTSKKSVNEVANFMRSALSGAGCALVVDINIQGAVGLTCNRGNLNAVLVIDQIRPETLNVTPFKGKDVTVGDSFIFIYHGIGKS